MTQLVQLPNGDNAEFPDDMAKEQIQSVIDDHLKQTAAPAPTQAPAGVQALQQQAQSPAGIQALQQQAPAPTQTSPALAVAGGIANATASATESIGDSALWLAHTLGKVPQALGLADHNTNMSDEQYNRAKLALNWTENHNVAGTGLPLRVSAKGNDSNILNQAVKEYPWTAGTAEIGTDLATIAATPFTKSTLVNSVLNAVQAAGIGNGNEDMSAVIGAAGGLAAKPIEWGIQKIAKSASWTSSVIKQYLEPIHARLLADQSMSIAEKGLKAEAVTTGATLNQSSAYYDPIKQIPGTITQPPIARAANGLLLKTGSKYDTTIGVLNHTNSSLDTGQQKVLQSISAASSRMTTMEDAIRLKQYVLGNADKFSGKAATSDVEAAYQILLQGISRAINQKAKAAGLGKALKVADNFYSNQVSPLIASKSVQRLATVNKQVTQQAYVDSSAGAATSAKTIISTKYSSAAKQLLPNNMTPEQLSSVTARMGDSGRQVVEDHFVYTAFKDLLANPENANINKTLMNLNTVRAKYGNVLAPKTLQTIDGAITLLKEAGAIAETSTTPGAVSSLLHHPYLVGALAAGATGAASGYQNGGAGEAVKDAVIGLFLGAAAVKGVKAFNSGVLNSGPGQALLRHIADHPEVAHGVVQNLIMAVPQMNSQDNQSNPNAR